MLSKSFLEMLRVRNSKKNGELKKLKKAPKWLEPLTAERGYTASLFLYTFQIRKHITEQVLPRLPKWIELSTLTYPDPIDPIKNDDIIDDVLKDLEQTLDFVQDLLIPAEARAIESAEKFGAEVAIFNDRQNDKITESVLGVDIFQEEPWLETQLSLYADQNAQLIQSMTKNEIERVSGIIQRGLQEGASLQSVTKNIENSFGITRRHARLIARDQTTKLNASLTKLRQQNLGIKRYRWLTAGDVCGGKSTRCVRKTHRVLDEKICRWDDPTVYLDEKTGRWLKRSTIGGTLVSPGVDVNCRCQAIAIFEDLF